MRWQDERYVRFYTRNSPEWCVLSWQARGLFGLILRELDRAGILPLGKLGLRAVAVAVRASWEEIEKPLTEILADGMAVYREDLQLLVVPNFVEAQEASQSDKARKRTERERARDLAKATSLSVSQPSQNVTVPANGVTSSHAPSHDVTSSHSEPSRAVPCQAVPSLAVQSSAGGAALRLPGLKEIEAAIRRHRLFDPLDAHAIALQQAERLITAPQKPQWMIVAIEECAAKSVGLGLTPEALQAKLVGFMLHAKRPKEPPKDPRRHVETDDDDPPMTEEEADANRRRMDERNAAAKAERERRARIDAELSSSSGVRT